MFLVYGLDYRFGVVSLAFFRLRVLLLVLFGFSPLLFTLGPVYPLGLGLMVAHVLLNHKTKMNFGILSVVFLQNSSYLELFFRMMMVVVFQITKSLCFSKVWYNLALAFGVVLGTSLIKIFLISQIIIYFCGTFVFSFLFDKKRYHKTNKRIIRGNWDHSIVK